MVNCPKCGESLEIKGKSLRAVDGPKLSHTAFLDRFLMDMLKMDIPARNAAYPRYVRTAKEILQIVGDEKKAFEVCGVIIRHYQKQGLNWTLDSVAKALPAYILDSRAFGVQRTYVKPSEACYDCKKRPPTKDTNYCEECLRERV